MSCYHSISVNRKGTIAHAKNNSHSYAVKKAHWVENTPERTYHWDFEWNPEGDMFESVWDLLHNRKEYAQDPPTKVLQVAEEHYQRLWELHHGEYNHIDYFAGEDYIDITLTIAQNPSTDAEILVKLAEAENWRVKCGVARNPNTPTKILARLTEDEDWRVKCGVARNPNAHPKTLTRLAEDEHWRVKCSVTENPNTPAKTLARLAEDENRLVQCGIVENPNTPAKILAKLADAEHWRVKGGVAEHPNTPTEILVKLVKDDDPGVARAAKQALERRNAGK